MCLYESMAHIVTLVHLCMNEVKYDYVWFKGVMWKVCSHVCTHKHVWWSNNRLGLERCSQEYR